MGDPPQEPCPGCGAPLRAATGLNGDGRPSPGDFSVCAYCQTVVRVDGGARYVPATAAEIERDLSPGQRALIRAAQLALAAGSSRFN